MCKLSIKYSFFVARDKYFKILYFSINLFNIRYISIQKIFYICKNVLHLSYFSYLKLPPFFSFRWSFSHFFTHWWCFCFILLFFDLTRNQGLRHKLNLQCIFVIIFQQILTNLQWVCWCLRRRKWWRLSSRAGDRIPRVWTDNLEGRKIKINQRSNRLSNKLREFLINLYFWQNSNH